MTQTSTPLLDSPVDDRVKLRPSVRHALRWLASWMCAHAPAALVCSTCDSHGRFWSGLLSDMKVFNPVSRADKATVSAATKYSPDIHSRQEADVESAELSDIPFTFASGSTNQFTADSVYSFIICWKCWTLSYINDRVSLTQLLVMLERFVFVDLIIKCDAGKIHCVCLQTASTNINFWY